jgi:hypothetical protein
MAERTAEQIRSEIAAERSALHNDIDGLKANLRARLPFLIAGIAATAALVIGLFLSIRRLRKSY